MGVHLPRGAVHRLRRATRFGRVPSAGRLPGVCALAVSGPGDGSGRAAGEGLQSGRAKQQVTHQCFLYVGYVVYVGYVGCVVCFLYVG